MSINITGISVIEDRKQEITSPEGVFSVLIDQTKRLKVFFEDILMPELEVESEPTVQRYDPQVIEFIEYDPWDAELRTGSLAGGEVKKAANGAYYFETRDADPPARVDSDTADAGMQTVLWKSRRQADSEEDQELQYLIAYPLHVARLFPLLRSQIDKAQKDTSSTVGYTAAQMVIYLQAALETLNVQSPLTGLTMQNYPFQAFTQLLIDVATIIALQSQGIFAIDTDFNYSDSGFSFVIDHYSKISGFLSMLGSRLSTQIPNFKMSYASHGTLHVEMGPSYRLSVLLGAAPSGSLFRNTFAGG